MAAFLHMRMLAATYHSLLCGSGESMCRPLPDSSIPLCARLTNPAVVAVAHEGTRARLLARATHTLPAGRARSTSNTLAWRAAATGVTVVPVWACSTRLACRCSTPVLVFTLRTITCHWCGAAITLVPLVTIAAHPVVRHAASHFFALAHVACRVRCAVCVPCRFAGMVFHGCALSVSPAIGATLLAIRLPVCVLVAASSTA